MNQLRKFISKYKIIILYSIISFLFVIALFKEGNLLGAGESGLHFYNISRILQVSSTTWTDISLGFNNILSLANIPFLSIFSIFEILKIPNFLLQALFFDLVMFFMLYGIYLFIGLLFPGTTILSRFFAGIFYAINFYAMVNIWNRYMLNFMVFYAVLPLLLFVFVTGLIKKKSNYAFYVNLLLILSSFAFSSPVAVIIFWSLCLYFVIFLLINSNDRGFIIKYLLVSISLWLFFNLWWLYTYIYSLFSTAGKETFFVASDPVDSLRAISEILGKLSSAFLLKHATFFSGSVKFPFAWPLVFDKPLALVIEWVVTLTVLIGAIINIRKNWTFAFLLLFILGVFLSKGIAQPFGELFLFFFRKISFLQVFRNPFEKLGIIASFSLSVLFSLSLTNINKYLRRKGEILYYLLFLAVSIYFIVFLGFPFWTGLIYTNGFPKNNDYRVGIRVLVPEYYNKVNQWFNQKRDDYRYMALPISNEGIFYDWEKGYNGVELSSLFFSKPGISNILGFAYYENTLRDIERLFLKYNDFSRVASLLNVKYLIVRSDIDFRASNIRDPETIKSKLDKNKFLSSSGINKVADFGKLNIYEFVGKYISPKIYPAKEIVVSDDRSTPEDLYLADVEFDVAIVNSEDTSKNNVSAFKPSMVFHPNSWFKYEGSDIKKYSSDIMILPYVRRLPGDFIYRLALFKENLIHLLLNKKEQRIEYDISLLGKRLEEVDKLIEIGDVRLVSLPLGLYQKQLHTVISELKSLPTDRYSNRPRWNPDLFKTSFDTQSILLDRFIEKLQNSERLHDQLMETKASLDEDLKSLYLIPVYDPIIDEDFPLNNRFIYQFRTDVDSDYQLIFPDLNIKDFFKIPLNMEVQVDNDIEIITPAFSSEGYLNLGKYYLSRGIHEIGINIPEKINMVDFDEELSINALHETKNINFPVSQYDPVGYYNVFVKYYIYAGESPSLSFNLNTNRIIDGKEVSYFGKKLPQDNYFFGERDFTAFIGPSLSADSAYLSLQVDPWNNCKNLRGYKIEDCNNPLIRSRYDRDTNVEIKDVKVTKAYPSFPVLVSKNTENRDTDVPYVSFEKVNSTKYRVFVKNSTGPYLLVFSELFNRDWQVLLGDQNEKSTTLLGNIFSKSYFEDNHILVNNYANGWIIDKKGDYEIIIEFKQQKYFYYGCIISFVSVTFATIYLLSKLRRIHD